MCKPTSCYVCHLSSLQAHILDDTGPGLSHNLVLACTITGHHSVSILNRGRWGERSGHEKLASCRKRGSVSTTGPHTLTEAGKGGTESGDVIGAYKILPNASCRGTPSLPSSRVRPRTMAWASGIGIIGNEEPIFL